MIDPHGRGRTKPILRCPECSRLYGPTMTACAWCGGPLVPATGPKQLPDVPFATRDLPAKTYRRGESFAVESPKKVYL